MSDVFASLPLTALKVFLVAARHRTFTAAAAELGVTQAAVSRQVAQLERALAVQLFVRGPRHLSLTHEGRDVARRLGPHFGALSEAAGEVLHRRRSRSVTLRVYPTFADRWLLPRLPRFEALHPDVELALDTTVEPLDFRSTPLDLAIQLGDGAWPETRAPVLFEDAIAPVCSPGYFDARGRDPERALAEGRLIASHYRRTDWTAWCAATGRSPARPAGLTFGSSALAYRAAECGLGFAIAQLPLAAAAIEAGALLCPFEAAPREGLAFRVVWPTTASLRPQARRLAEWLLAEGARQDGREGGFSGARR